MRLAAVSLVTLAFALASAAVAAGDSRPPRQQHTAADTKLATKLVLRRSDFAAGWTADPPAKPTPPCTAGPDESAFVQTAKVNPSFTYKDGVTNVGSEADVFRTASEARKDWNASTPSLLGTCLVQSAAVGLGTRVPVKLASSHELAAPKGAERSLHYRYVLAVRAPKTRNLIIDVVALGRGRVTVVLYALTVHSPLPASVVTALTSILASRLNAGHGVTA